MNRPLSMTMALAPMLVAGWAQAAMSVGGGGPGMDSSTPLIKIYQEPGSSPSIPPSRGGESTQAGWPDSGGFGSPLRNPFGSALGPASLSGGSSLVAPAGGYAGAPMMESSPGSSFAPPASRPNPPSEWMAPGSLGQGGHFPGSSWIGGGSSGGYAAPGQSGQGGTPSYPGPGGGLPPPGVYPGGMGSGFGSPWGAGAFPAGIPAPSVQGTDVGGAGTASRPYPGLSGSMTSPLGAAMNEPSLMPGGDRGGAGGYGPGGSGWGPGGFGLPGQGGAPGWGPWSSMMADPLMLLLERHLDFMERLDRIEAKLQEILERLPKSPTP